MRVRRFQLPGAACLPEITTALFLLAAFDALAEGLQLSRIPDVVTYEDTPTAPIPFTIDGEDANNKAGFLITSSNTSLVPESNVRFGQTATARTLVITPAANQSGRTVVQLHATHGSMTVTRSFSITINSVNDAPTISRIADQIIGESAAPSPIPFAIGDVETPCASLIVTAHSSDPNLLSNESIRLAGAGAARTIALHPTSGKSGKLTLTVTVDDGESSTSQQFQVSVGTVNRAPIANAGPDQTIVGSDTAVLNGTATDDNPMGLLTIWTLVTGPEGVSFADSAALNTAVHCPRPGIYTMRLTASDGEQSGSDDVTIVIGELQFAGIKGKLPKSR
jgi:hypothetical protein